MTGAEILIRLDLLISGGLRGLVPPFRYLFDALPNQNPKVRLFRTSFACVFIFVRFSSMHALAKAGQSFHFSIMGESSTSMPLFIPLRHRRFLRQMAS